MTKPFHGWRLRPGTRPWNIRRTVTPPRAGDLTAGVSVALVLIPQALAYAELAGMPPVTGLYAAAAAPLAAALVGSSPYLQTGPVALTSLLTFGALAPHATAGTASFVGYAMLLAILVGVTRVAVGLLRWGSVAYLMSLPVITGFTAAAAVLIVASQVPELLGVTAHADSPLVAAGQALGRPSGWGVTTIIVGLATVAVVVGGRRISELFPWALLATVAGLVVSALGVVDVATIGPIPSGLPELHLDLPWHATPDLVVPALVIALVGFAEPASIARRYAAAERTPWNPDKEFVGQGLANLSSGLFGGYPVGGSFSRSALSHLAGAKTRWSGAISGAVVVAALPVATLLSPLPQAVLAALVIVATASLIDVTPFAEYWRYSRPQFLVAVATFGATLVAAPRVERGILVGVGLAFAVHLWREMRLDVDAWRDGGTLHVRPHGVLYFASAPALEGRMMALLAEHHDITRIVIELRCLGRLDLTALYVLRNLVDHIQDSGIPVDLKDVPAHAADRVQRVFGPSEADTHSIHIATQ